MQWNGQRHSSSTSSNRKTTEKECGWTQTLTGFWKGSLKLWTNVLPVTLTEYSLWVIWSHNVSTKILFTLMNWKFSEHSGITFSILNGKVSVSWELGKHFQVWMASLIQMTQFFLKVTSPKVAFIFNCLQINIHFIQRWLFSVLFRISLLCFCLAFH